MGEIGKHYRRFQVQCPRCEYAYTIDVFEEPAWELCSLCGYIDYFSSFPHKEVEYNAFW